MTALKSNELNMTAVVLLKCTSQVFKIYPRKTNSSNATRANTPMEIIIAYNITLVKEL